MNISTAIIGMILLTTMFFAVRHVWTNVKTGKHDCCDCSGASSCCGGNSNTCHCGEVSSK